MCESVVFLIRGSERELIMEEAAKVIVDGRRIVCVNTLGERKAVDDAEISEANLVKHEILLRPIMD